MTRLWVIAHEGAGMTGVAGSPARSGPGLCSGCGRSGDLGSDPRIFNWSPAPSFVPVVLLKLVVVAVLLLRAHLPPRVAVLLSPAQLTFTNRFGALPSAHPKLHTLTYSKCPCRSSQESSKGKGWQDLIVPHQHVRAGRPQSGRTTAVTKIETRWSLESSQPRTIPAVR